jgi:hypothetical protein
MKLRFKIGDYIRCLALVEMTYEGDRRKVQKKTVLGGDIFGWISGISYRQEGIYIHGTSASRFSSFGEDSAEPAYLQVTRRVRLWKVAISMTQTVEVLDEDIQLVEAPMFLHKSRAVQPLRVLTLSAEDRKFLAAAANESPRDAKGRFLPAKEKV